MLDETKQKKAQRLAKAALADTLEQVRQIAADKTWLRRKAEDLLLGALGVETNYGRLVVGHGSLLRADLQRIAQSVAADVFAEINDIDIKQFAARAKKDKDLRGSIRDIFEEELHNAVVERAAEVAAAMITEDQDLINGIVAAVARQEGYIIDYLLPTEEET